MLAALPTLVNWMRMLFIGLLQAGAATVVINVLEKTVDYVRSVLKRDGDLSEAEADDAMLEMTLEVLAITGITVAALKSKIPIRLADKLGLKSASPRKPTLSAKTRKGVAQAISKGGLKGSLLKTFLLGFVGSLGAGAIWLPSLIQNFADQAIFAPEQTNAFYGKYFGIQPAPARPTKPGQVLSDDIFNKVFTTYKELGALGIDDNDKFQTLVFTRDNLVAITNKVAANLLVQGKKADTKAIIEALRPLISLPRGKSHPVINIAPAPTYSAPAPTYTPPAPTVFTGIVSSGTLGDSSNFVARPDDLITDIKDMEAAMRNNLASFLAALPGRVVYEVKVVPSYITKDGMTIRGTTQTVPNGTYANGTPKTKSVTNKFAVANLYLVTSKGTRTKIDQIVLGPIDAVRFQPQQADLTALESTVKKTIFTSYPSAKAEAEAAEEDEKEERSNVLTAEEKRASRDSAGRLGESLSFSQTGSDTLYMVNGLYYYPSTQFPGTFRSLKPGTTTKRKINAGLIKVIQLTPDEYIPEPSNKEHQRLYLEGNWPPKEAPPPPPPPPPPPDRPKNLTEFFALTKDPLPSIQERAALYHKLELGNFAYYTGTAEQNEKLLAALLAQSGIS